MAKSQPRFIARSPSQTSVDTPLQFDNVHDCGCRRSCIASLQGLLVVLLFQVVVRFDLGKEGHAELLQELS